MVFSGLVVPFFMLWNAEGWRLSWGTLAFCVLVILIINILFLVDDPAKLNIKPVGIQIQSDRRKEKNPLLIENIYRDKNIILIGLIYFSWGFSYLIFSTFFVDFLMIHANINMDIAGKFYAAAGIVSVLSGFIWGRLSDGIGRILTLFLVYFIQTIVLVAFALTLNPALLFIETIIYALTLWAVPTVIVAAVSDITVSLKASMAVGYITLFFGIGQWISPMITGSIVDNFSYTVAFYLSAIVCCLGSIGCLYLHFSFRQKKKLPLNNVMEEEQGFS
jgi:predicted MFS family arabinose efflux permease